MAAIATITIALVGTSQGSGTAAKKASTQDEETTPPAKWPARTRYQNVEVLGRQIFYREAGDVDRPALLLLHGYPSSSHTYRELIPLLSGRFRVIAPDNLGSGYSAHPSPEDMVYTFDVLADHLSAFVDAIGLQKFALYMQDFGGPVGFRLALRHPDRIRAVIVQNANAYLDGLTPARQEFFRQAHDDRTPDQIQQLLRWVSDQAIRETQYLRDVPGQRKKTMSPDSWTHDIAMLRSPGDRLFQDYQTNIDQYPLWHEHFRKYQPPALILWGERDPAFIANGAKAYLRDLPEAELHLIDAGHFAAEERPVEIAQHVIRFLERVLSEKSESRAE